MITQEKLKSVLSYDRETGVFRWIQKLSRATVVGRVAGSSLVSGYLRIGLYGQSYRAHRLAWLYERGYMPEQIDHINGNKKDNRLCNLRPATRSQQQSNKGVTRRSKTGLKGVSYDGVGYKASIDIEGKTRYLGYFKTPETAYAAYCHAAKTHHGEFFHP